MWILQSYDDPGKLYRLIPGKDYVVGRKDCEIIIENDKSISRKHATLTVTYVETNLCNPANKSTLEVEDCSKFGTYVNQIQVKEKSKHKIQAGDVIKFGGLNSRWRVKCQPIIITTSTLKGSVNKSKVKTTVSQLGGHVVPEWRKENTHLVMSSLILTIKTVCVLLDAKPIITPEYLEELLKSLQNNTDVPNVKNYLPQLAEVALVGKDIDFAPSEMRKKLFIGKTFLFASAKQMSKFQMPIELGCGQTVLISSAPTASYLARPGVCMMAPSPDVSSQPSGNTLVQSATNILKKHSRRFIPESEIGLAAVYCSVEKYCNPDFEIEHDPLSMNSQTQEGQTQNSNTHTQQSLFGGNGTSDLFASTSTSTVPERNRARITAPASPERSTSGRKHTRRMGLDDNSYEPNPKIRRVENCSEDEDLFGGPSIMDVDEQNDSEVETITLDCASQSGKEKVNVSPQINTSTANSNWTLNTQRAPIAESTRRSEEIEKEMESDENINNYTVVEIKSLIVVRQRLPSYESDTDTNNFKKFKKAMPLRTRNDNIGINEMQVHQNNASDMTGNWTQEYGHSTTDQGTQDEDLFDWEPTRRGRR